LVVTPVPLAFLGCLPLHIAIVSPHADESLLAELLRAGAEVNGREEDGGN
jgi:hypothetical protein